MWVGHGCSGTAHKIGDGTSVDYMASALRYKQKMGTATQHDVDRLNAEKQKWNDDADENNRSMVFLYLYLGGMIYLTIAQRPKNYILDWIETGKFKRTDDPGAKT